MWDFAKAWAQGLSQTEAARAAGYADPQQSGWELARKPDVLMAVSVLRRQYIVSKGSKRAIDTMYELMDEAQPAGVRFQAAKWMLEAAGLGAGAAARGASEGEPGAADGAIGEMDEAGLQAVIAAARDAIKSGGRVSVTLGNPDVDELMRADLARDVTPQRAGKRPA